MTFALPEPVIYGPLTRTDLVRYAGASGDFNPLHHDHEFASNAGLPDVMAHGMLSAGLLASALTKWFGAGSVRRYSIRFRSPVWPGDVLTAHCRGAEMLADDSGQVADLVLELVRGDGDAVIAGTARVTIADPSRPDPRQADETTRGIQERPSMMTPAVTIRPALPKDRAAFLEMWRDFVALAPGEPGNHQMGERNWERIADAATGLRCIVAADASDTPQGFTLFLTFPFTWSKGDACYLQDIYVRAESRGNGAARAMISHLEQLGREAGWFKVFWMTQPDNLTAQRLYDRIAQRMDYLRYDLNVAEP